MLSPDHADVGVRLGEGPGAGRGRAVAAGVPGVPAHTLGGLASVNHGCLHFPNKYYTAIKKT